MHLFGEAETRQLQAIGPEGVGLDDLGAGTQVGLMDADHQVGLRQVQVLECAIEEDTPGVQLGAHRAVADQHPSAQGVEEGLVHVDAYLRVAEGCAWLPIGTSRSSLSQTKSSLLYTASS